MASSALPTIDLSPEPDLHPIYPTPSFLVPLLSTQSGLSPAQKSELVAHSLSRACVFGELSLLSYLLTDHTAQSLIDLSARDEDGLGLVSTAIHGFGAESDRDVEREECVRLLIAEGADVSTVDNAGWTPLHHAALLAPPSLVSHLMTHGCSLFALTRRNLTPLDIVTAHTTLPGREDVALLLGEAMRSEGWTGSRMEERRKLVERRIARRAKQRSVRDDISRQLEISPRWWGDEGWDDASDDESDDDEPEDDKVYTPPPDYATMLVFSPPSLPYIFQSLITNYQPSLRNSEPANALYMLARFACLTCDNTWLEDLIIGATDAIEDTFFNRSEDLTCLVFWLYNTTAWLHLMRCDNSINETCEVLGSFALIEEVMNSVFVFIIRYIERRIDSLIETAILDHAPLPTEFEDVQFESEWSFLRSFGKKKTATPASVMRVATPSSPPSPSRPITPPASTGSARNFASIRNTFSRSRAQSATTPLQSLFADTVPPQSAGPNPSDITSFFDALQTLFTLSGINPALITQLWSQVFYWIACEIFNRVLTRKKYLCRSRAVQVGMNLGALEEWVETVNLPRGVISHLAPVRDLLNWLQCLSSITEFANLVATIQTMKHLNPLQMRRAVRDYKYEVNEGRMTDECSQYLAQMQKDWERHRVKLGVEQLRKEMSEREREDDLASVLNDSGSHHRLASSVSSISSELSFAQRNVDLLFECDADGASWEPAKPPEVLGEFLDSRHMLPLLLPSDPRMLSASPKKPPFWSGLPAPGTERSASRSSRRSAGSIPWHTSTRRMRDIGLEMLRWVDGIGAISRWTRPLQIDDADALDASTTPPYDHDTYDYDEELAHGHQGDVTVTSETLDVPWVTSLTEKPAPHRGRSIPPTSPRDPPVSLPE
ncbi:DIL domain-containing protein [Vararia minispora EC-137]|uniref:DIL domain-containing protein n=1 Tax=Vararia minispora EC-137 TaxID=1314806 RepID=A0ACB8QPJ8_9AGAM|nr:DIL domain-containing protein [Vararia minispora EC-137]